VTFYEERLRDEAGGRTIVPVRIVDIVRVELDLAIVEVEVRGLVEIAIGIRIIVFAHPKSLELEVIMTSISEHFLFLYSLWQQSTISEFHLRQRQAVSPHW